MLRVARVSHVPAPGKVPFSVVETLVPLAFVLLWSTGFVGSKLGFPYAEPFTFLSLRFLLTLLLLLAVVVFTRPAWPRSWRQAGHIALSGVFLHAVYLSGTWYAIYLGLPAGLAALIVGLQPVLTAALAPLLGERVSVRAWTGLGLGFVGVALVVLDKLLVGHHQAVQPMALLAAGVALIGTTVGTLHQKRFSSTMPLVSGTIIQYTVTLLLVGPAALLFETRQVDWTPEFLFALGWLILALSLGAMFLLLYLLRSRTTARVTSLFYLVPPATALEAYLLFNETLGLAALFGMLVVVLGVWLVATDARKAA
ncbi:DMT family transporter [Deinococcus peraridilitoris]|uniref:DMT(Drug/metabolite transporter) superfamily permease n=1 Tax=Deinococcus peraridilitoris (strain DSM 19664 / LMG 22246 / CIP 109416 / KR-200) TaxID=937777 RepID=L0A4D8_DEIPD|nr:DMT family transporter [Deinococcus peraridilitoris]AFZ68294.1 DMT(drug/metabolite transporter) superfamily permease [Deinococcus peraridilitoris DSM 19664]